MTLTRNGIAYNFYSSPYEVEVKYNNFNLTYRFSSKNNVNKFLSKQKETRLKINHSLSNRFKINLILDFIADLKLYSNVETRGFLIISEGINLECQEEVEFDGLKVMKKNLED